MYISTSELRPGDLGIEAIKKKKLVIRGIHFKSNEEYSTKPRDSLHVTTLRYQVSPYPAPSMYGQADTDYSR